MYIDTCIAVKLYTREPDSEECQQIAAGHRLVSSELLYTELWSALLAKERTGVLTSAWRQKVWQLFEEHLVDDVIELVALDGHVVREAAEVMARVHPAVPLRTLDALHLATYGGIEAGALFTRDKRMIEAARRLEYPLA
ncbi:MAG: type II toxin-antitoxin system VapC family toxin [Opitutaceae bacterium]|nr:type II toxin-antitoxin system VapC family toxin [Opitutaceae bacterium]